MTETKLQLEDWLDDLCVRFIINLPQEELESVERICFQVEEAQWFYEDFIRPLDASLPSMSLRTFCLRIFQHCPLLSSFSQYHHATAFSEFLNYKTRVPVRGAIMLNDAMDHVVLVKGWKKNANWSFPRGKINKDEPDLDCAVREVYEETGFDLSTSGLAMDEENTKSIEITLREQNMRLYVFPGVPMDTIFEPRTRKEISKISWHRLSELPTYKKSKQQQQAQETKELAINANKFYMVAPFLVPLKRWIAQQKKIDKPAQHKTQQIAPSYEAEETMTEEDQVENDPAPFATHAEDLSSRESKQAQPGQFPLESAMIDATMALKRLLRVNDKSTTSTPTIDSVPAPPLLPSMFLQSSAQFFGSPPPVQVHDQASQQMFDRPASRVSHQATYPMVDSPGHIVQHSRPASARELAPSQNDNGVHRNDPNRPVEERKPPQLSFAEAAPNSKIPKSNPPPESRLQPQHQPRRILQRPTPPTHSFMSLSHTRIPQATSAQFPQQHFQNMSHQSRVPPSTSSNLQAAPSSVDRYHSQISFIGVMSPTSHVPSPPNLIQSAPVMPQNLSFDRRGQQSAHHKQALLSLFREPSTVVGPSATIGHHGEAAPSASLGLPSRPAGRPQQVPTSVEVFEHRQRLLSSMPDLSDTTPIPSPPPIIHHTSSASSENRRNAPLLAPTQILARKQTPLSSSNQSSQIPAVPTASSTVGQKQALLSLFSRPMAASITPPSVPTDVSANLLTNLTQQGRNAKVVVKQIERSRAGSTVTRATEGPNNVSTSDRSEVPISPVDKGFLLGYLEGVARGH